MRTAISRKLVVGRRCANRAERSRSTDRIPRMTEKILCRVRGLAGQGEIVLQQCLSILFPSLAPLILTHLMNFGHHDAHRLTHYTGHISFRSIWVAHWPNCEQASALACLTKKLRWCWQTARRV